jgi:hypothetical protein
MVSLPPVNTRSSLLPVALVAMAVLACKSSNDPVRPPSASPRQRADASSLGAEGAACTHDDACGFGLVCTSGRCANSPCHDGNPMTPPRVCPGSQHCEFADPTAASKGRGRCVGNDPTSASETEAGTATTPSPRP